MTVVLLVISVEAGDYYYRGYEFIDSNLSFILSVESKDRGGLGGLSRDQNERE